MTSLGPTPLLVGEVAAGRRGANGEGPWLRRTFDAIVVTVSAVVVLAVIYPLVRLFQEAGAPWRAFDRLVSRDWFLGMVRDTVLVVGVSAVIAVLLGAVLAWINERTDAGLGALGDLLPLVPLFLPAVALSVGWVALATPKVGLLAWLLDPLGLSIHSFAGLVLVYVLLLVPYAYLTIVAAMRSVNPALEEAARTSGAGPLKVLRTISLPVVSPAILSSFILVVIIGASVYSVPAIIGQNTGLDILSVRILDSMRDTYPVDYTTAVQLSLVLLAALVLLYLAQKLVVSNRRFARVGGQAAKIGRVPLGGWRWAARAVTLGYVVVATVLPLLGVLFLSLQRFWQGSLTQAKWTFDNFTEVFTGPNNALLALRNTLLLGLGCGVVVVLVATLVVTYARQTNSRLARIADGVGRLPAVVPQAVLCVSLIFAIGGSPFYLAGTMSIMAIAFVLNFLPIAIISVDAVSSQLDGSLEQAARLSGAGSGRIFFGIVVPLLRPGLVMAFALVFVRVVSDLEIVLLLGTQSTVTVSWMLFDAWYTGLFTQMAAIAIVLGVISALVVSIGLWFSRPQWMRRRQTPPRSGKAT